jgi:hypothetical protein
LGPACFEFAATAAWVLAPASRNFKLETNCRSVESWAKTYRQVEKDREKGMKTKLATLAFVAASALAGLG